MADALQEHGCHEEVGISDTKVETALGPSVARPSLSKSRVAPSTMSLKLTAFFDWYGGQDYTEHDLRSL
jgi:hypothetical protein